MEKQIPTINKELNEFIISMDVPEFDLISDTELQINNVFVEITQNDLVHEEVHAITNPANSKLNHGGGAALAIKKAGEE